MTTSNTPKVILITGTSSGLGMHLAVMLSKLGHTVYATMRDLGKQDALVAMAKDNQTTLIIKQLDVQKNGSVRACVNELIQEQGRVDVLINNAGAGFVRTTEQASEQEIDWVMDVNYTGVVRCIKAVLPVMREAKSGHIINVTSVGGLVGQPFNEFYCAAKFAVEGYTESLASYIPQHFGVNFTCVEPGGIQSEFAKSALAQFQAGGGMQEDEYAPILGKYIASAQTRAASADSAGVYQTPKQVSQVLIDCIEMENPPLRLRTSTWAKQFCQLKTQADPSGELLVKNVYDSSFSD